MAITVWLAAAAALGQQVRIGYLIPQDRTAQSEGTANLQSLVGEIQAWYADEMSRYGFDPKTFVVEMQADGLTPLVHVASVASTAAQLRDDLWSNTLSAASGAGVSVWGSGEVWLLVPEAHVQSSDGSIAGGTALGASFGSGLDAGVAMVGSDNLPQFDPEWLLDETPYAGTFIPGIGPYPLVQDVSFPWFEGTTYSSSSSASQGAAAHELGHAFGLPHDFRNDANFRGVLMGNGLRGWRGSKHPDLFPDDEAALSYAAAIVLNTSRYFNADDGPVESTKPSLTINASGMVDPIDGQLAIPFHAVGAAGLSAAVLLRNGEAISEMPLSGQQVDATFLTPYYSTANSDDFEIRVYDVHGNRRDATTNLRVAAGFNRAPQPFITLDDRSVTTADAAALRANKSTDPDGASGSLLVEWDLDGDGVYDTAPTSGKALRTTFETPGDWLIRARLTDADGGWAESTLVSLRVFNALPGDADLNQVVDLLDFNLLKSTFGSSGRGLAADFNLNRTVDLDDFAALKANFGIATRVPEPPAVLLSLLALGIFRWRRVPSGSRFHQLVRPLATRLGGSAPVFQVHRRERRAFDPPAVDDRLQSAAEPHGEFFERGAAGLLRQGGA